MILATAVMRIVKRGAQGGFVPTTGLFRLTFEYAFDLASLT
jgi:hypothetical protein